MRFTIAREKLQEALTSVAPAVPAKTTLPVLANILVEASERGVRFSGTDLDVAVSVEVPADVEMPGALTLPAKRLGEITRGREARNSGADDEDVWVHTWATCRARRACTTPRPL